MREIRRYPDFVLFVVYNIFITSIFLKGCGTWWIRHTHCSIHLYYQYFPRLKIKYKKVFAFMLKFHIFVLLMHFMNRFCCRLWPSRLTNIFLLMKNFIIFKGNMQNMDISLKIKFREICNL